MVNNITTRTIYYIISLAAVILPLVACTAAKPEIRGIEVTRVVERTVEVPVMEVAEQAVEVTRKVPMTVTVTTTEPPPTPAPGATTTSKPTHSPTPHTSRWIFFEGPHDPIIGGKSHGLRVTGTMISPADYASLFRDPRLYLRCDAGILETYVTWGSRFIAGNLRTETIATVYRVDGKTPVNTTSSESEDNEVSFLMEPTRFVRDLRGTKKVVIRVTNYDDTEMTAVFPTAGLSADIAKLSCWR